MIRDMNLPGTADAIQHWIEQQVRTTLTDGVVIGLSGGIDSAVTAALCARALGSKRVHGMILPCYSSEDSVKDAIELATNLGIDWTQVYLNPMNDDFAMDLSGISKLARGNLRSRLRMCALYAQANTLHRLVCGTTNMTEMVLGYYTKYGDGGVDIEPIAKLLKGEVRAMARHLNANNPVIPRHTIEKAPSADLGISKTDEDELGYSYDELDAAVHKMIIKGEFIPLDAPGAEGVVRRRYGMNQHKRETPPQCPHPG